MQALTSARLSNSKNVAFHGKTEITEEFIEKEKIYRNIRARLSESQIMRDVGLTDIKENSSLDRGHTRVINHSCKELLLFIKN